MKIRKILTPLLFAALAITANAADAPKTAAVTVAVYDFSGDPDASNYVKNVTTLVTVNLTTETNLVLLERASLAKALQEQSLGVSGIVSSDAAAKIGQITGAKVLVAGQVVKLGDNHLVLVADVIGTETGRLFAAKVEGAADNLMALTDQLSRKIAQTISDHTTNLIGAVQETAEQRLDRIIKGLGTNRPSVSVSIHWTPTGTARTNYSPYANGEFGTVLLKAGFQVVDAKSDQKPDVEITGTENSSPEPRKGDLYSCANVIDVKVQFRRTGKIIAVEHLVGSATEAGTNAAIAAAQVNAVDLVCEKILPVLAGQPAPAVFAKTADAPKSPLTLATYDFSGDADAARYVNKVTTLVTVNLTSETNLVMLERAELTKALKEQAFGISGMVSSDAAAKIGQITGAKVLVAGQVMKLGDNHLVLVADVIGTETGRLFAAKVEGAADNLLALTDELSRKIAQSISDHTADLVAAAQETGEQRLERIIKGLGANRPSVSVGIHFIMAGSGKIDDSPYANGEFGTVLLKAGFPLVDAKSDEKPDVEITGMEHTSADARLGGLYSRSDPMDVQVRERRTGKIIAVEHQVGSATAAGSNAAIAASVVNAVDLICEKILPLLAK
jgi:TolB-like protein